jgi:predicted N-formylglutamate amidohydrolase
VEGLEIGWTLLLTCEHAGARVPASYAELFRSPEARQALQSHRGSDLGSLPLARRLQRALKTQLLLHDVTRLLVEVNRSPRHPRLFSEFSRHLDGKQRNEILDLYYHPHRRAIQDWIESAITAGQRVAHVGVHSFTPVWNGQPRNADVGLLYDPRREHEHSFCRNWRNNLLTRHAELRVRRNYPYRGRDDGLTTALRRHFPAHQYLGVELEVNQARLERRSSLQAIADLLAAAYPV